MLLAAAGAALGLLLLDLVVFGPAGTRAGTLDLALQKKIQERDMDELVLGRAERIRSSWEAHRKRAPAGTREELEAAFQADVVKLLEKARIRGEGFTKRPERPHGEFVELVFTTSFTVSNDELVNLMKVLDQYEGYLRATLLEAQKRKDKQDEKLDVKLEVSTIWFSAGKEGRS
jgi:hypothetical protein